MSDSPTAGPGRCLGVAGGASAGLALVAAVLLPELAAARAALVNPASPSFDQLLVWLCAATGLLAAAWLWAATCLVSLAAVRGRDTGVVGVPMALRRLVLAGCGVALAGTVLGTVSATAAGPGGTDPGAVRAERPSAGRAGQLSGLPLPDRATGAGLRGTAPGVHPWRPRTSGGAHFHDEVVRVRPGDTLWALAVRHLPAGADDARITACWQHIHELNRDVIGADPDLILPDQWLRLPRH